MAESLKPLKSFKKDIPLKGQIEVAPDKSISHRSLIFSALAHGESKISNLLEGEDVLKTAEALRKMGAKIHRSKDGTYNINGVGFCGLNEPDDILDMGNSGTAARLLAGLVTPYNFTTFFTGDNSLRKRPMKRIFGPIEDFGAKIIARENNLMPFAIIGAKNPMPINHEMKVASAQVKSCILLASLCVNGQTKIIEPVKCRDHTEIMMRSLGLKIKSKDISHSSGSIGTEITFNGFQEFDGRNFEVPGDISSAAFLIVAALIIKDSKILIKNIGLNPLRDGILTTLLEMGGNISLQNEREVNGEKIADILVEYSQLKAVDVPASRAASMIDEYPILSIASANAKGITKMNGIGELKVKESNRLLMIANGLEACGVKINMGEDFLEVQGGIEQKNNIIKIQTALDHRIAMSFLIMGLKMENGIEIDDSKMIKTSFPNFENIFANMKNNFSS